eukprot:SAG31_NODE_24286_length_485_cov_0.715026_1_plen_49_part_10
MYVLWSTDSGTTSFRPDPTLPESVGDGFEAIWVFTGAGAACDGVLAAAV